MSDPKTENENSPSPTGAFKRRDVLLGLGAAAAIGYTVPANSAMPGHDHSKHATQKPGVLNATNECLDKAQRCIAHCLVSFREGDTELAECAAKVHEMRAICEGFSYLAASNSEYTKEYSSLCRRACKDCAKVCREHDEHHECRECAEACEALIDEIDMAWS